MARRRRGRSYRSKKGSSKVILVLIAFLIFLVFSIIRTIVSAFQNIEVYFLKQNALIQTVFVIAMIGFCLLTVWIVFEVKNKRRAELIRLQMEREQEEKRQISRLRDLNYLKKMCPFEFEEYMARVFRCAGYESKVTKRTGDGGKDIILRRNGEVRLVECKRYTSPKVGRPDIQKFHSAMIDFNAVEGFYITTGEFTKQALECAENKSILTINGEHLLNLIEQYVGFEKEVLEH
ncbi:restriction endonuclease [Paenibacillus sp. VTT E-133280]|uniref:restriction endonuclease n=1 Tax=Paenibacillus sp. VTT E-133280 TaxID=1986222 RepID=UPI0015C5DC9B|nr:restriction endonuclease [Paenibacillus sp. VTT E-133280]